MLRPGYDTFERVVHRAAIAGRLIDQLSSTPLSDARVTLTEGPREWTDMLKALQEGRPALHPEISKSDAAGWVRFLDLPNGVYKLKAELPNTGTRYAAETTASVTVLPNVPVLIEIPIAPTAVVGKVTFDSGALALAKVRLVDSEEHTFTAEDGSFTLPAIESGSARKLEFSATRYLTTQQRINVVQGATTAAALVTLVHS
jgi:hypothetical protein